MRSVVEDIRLRQTLSDLRAAETALSGWWPPRRFVRDHFIISSIKRLQRILASVDTHPKDGDVQQAPLVSGAVGEAETPKGDPA